MHYEVPFELKSMLESLTALRAARPERLPGAAVDAPAPGLSTPAGRGAERPGLVDGVRSGVGMRRSLRSLPTPIILKFHSQISP